MKIFIGKKMLFLTSFPFGELREVIILGKKKDSNYYYFAKALGGSDSTTKDFLYNYPSERGIKGIVFDEEIKEVFERFGIHQSKFSEVLQ